MITNDATSSLSSISWCNLEWLKHYPLTEATVLDYFQESPWYDKTCLNELLKMQKRTSTSVDRSRFENVYEYIVESKIDEKLFLIKKLYRMQGNQTTVTELYLVYGNDSENLSRGRRGLVYPVPSIHSIFASSFVDIVKNVDEAFDTLTASLIEGKGQEKAVVPDGQLHHTQQTNEALYSRIVDRCISGIK